MGWSGSFNQGFQRRHGFLMAPLMREVTELRGLSLSLASTGGRIIQIEEGPRAAGATGKKEAAARLILVAGPVNVTARTSE